MQILITNFHRGSMPRNIWFSSREELLKSFLSLTEILKQECFKMEISVCYT